MTDNHAIVGAPGSGKAFIFEYDRQIGGWATTAIATISAYTGELGFGSSVTMTDNYAIVGAPGAGKAFIFEYDSGPGTWTTSPATTTIMRTQASQDLGRACR